MKELVWHGENLGATWDEREIRAELADKAAEYREKLVEAAVEQDEAAMSIGLGR